MKKIFLVMLTIMLTNFTFASETSDVANKVVDNTSSGVERLYEDGKVLGKEISDKAEKVIVQLAKGLKITSSEVWNILVQQQRVYSWTIFIGLIISLVSWGHFYYRFKVYKSDLTEKGKPKEHNGIITTVTFLSALVMSVLVSIHFYDMMTGFLNPEYGAMKHIIEVAKTFK